MIIEKTAGNLNDLAIGNRRIDPVLMDHYDLTKPHQRVKSQGGMDLAISLPRGEHLFAGAVLYQDEKKVVVVELLPEDVLEIRPAGTLEWGKAAFNIGNMHHPAYLLEDCILVPYDAIIERLMTSMEISCQRCNRKLEGQRANHVHGGHTHSHTHGEHTHTHEQEQ